MPAQQAVIKFKHNKNNNKNKFLHCKSQNLLGFSQSFFGRICWAIFTLFICTWPHNNCFGWVKYQCHWSKKVETEKQSTLNLPKSPFLSYKSRKEKPPRFPVFNLSSIKMSQQSRAGPQSFCYSRSNWPHKL